MVFVLDGNASLVNLSCSLIENLERSKIIAPFKIVNFCITRPRLCAYRARQIQNRTIIYLGCFFRNFHTEK